MKDCKKLHAASLNCVIVSLGRGRFLLVAGSTRVVISENVLPGSFSVVIKFSFCNSS